MNVQIVIFPETRVAAIEHWGPNSNSSCWTSRDTAATAFTTPTQGPRQLASTMSSFACPSNARRSVPTASASWRKSIPPNRCALARDIGSRHDNKAAKYLKEVWLARSRETAGSFPIFFHYVNVGPCVRNEDMITDVYLPLK